jgi:redox-regulated HSP33 family molecular chaperone
MRKLLALALVLVFFGCGSDKWNKDYLVNDCLREINKEMEKNRVFTTMQVANICDCSSEKLLAKYKSARESNKDEAGTAEVIKECTLEVISK